MKKKLLILSASISLLLACFPFALSAEEDPQSDLGVSAPSPIPELDSYFFENYVQLPYIQSNGSQAINTGVVGKSTYRTEIRFSDISGQSNYLGIFGDNNSVYSAYIEKQNDRSRFKFNVNTFNYSTAYQNYLIYDILLDQNKLYMNNELLTTFADDSFTGSNNIYLFAISQNSALSNYKLYSFSIYDYALNDGEGDYIRYYYPARSKASDTIGLYDAVSKTFITTATATPFADPQGSDASMSITSKVTTFVLSSLGWIGDILDYAISEPVILLFMSIGLAGATFRWARRLVHF